MLEEYVNLEKKVIDIFVPAIGEVDFDGRKNYTAITTKIDLDTLPDEELEEKLTVLKREVILAHIDRS